MKRLYKIIIYSMALTLLSCSGGSEDPIVANLSISIVPEEPFVFNFNLEDGQLGNDGEVKAPWFRGAFTFTNNNAAADTNIVLQGFSMDCVSGKGGTTNIEEAFDSSMTLLRGGGTSQKTYFFGGFDDNSDVATNRYRCTLEVFGWVGSDADTDDPVDSFKKTFTFSAQEP
ncbi:MAG: hypothetical protein R2827_08255 [Bdellovibrionales bacterium]